MKVLITGGSGFIGSIVASKVIQKGHQVAIYDIDVRDSGEDHTEYIKGDVFDSECLTTAIRKCDAVIHMVGLPDARTAQEQPQTSFDLNVLSLQVLLESMRGNGSVKLVFPSSAAVYGTVDSSPVNEETPLKPSGVYPYHKYMAEKLAEIYSMNYGINITVLRLFNVYGINGQGILNVLLNKATDGEPIKLYGEKQKRDFIHVSDVANVFSSALELNNKFEIYNVGTGIGRSIENLVKMVQEYFPSLSIDYGEFNGSLYDSVADIHKLQSVINFYPDKSDSKLREMIQNHSRPIYIGTMSS